jgi:hypothetical protein
MDAFLRLLNRVGVLQASPRWEGMPPAQQEAFEARVLALASREDAGFDDLSEADKELIRAGELEVSAGKSSRFTDPATWGDWAAIDAAIDAEDTEALDRELEMVGPLDGPAAGSVDGAPETKAADFDLEGDWVGL